MDNMTKAYVIAEVFGPSTAEWCIIPFVYMKREWAEYQIAILKKEDEFGNYEVREVTIVTEGPKGEK